MRSAFTLTFKSVDWIKSITLHNVGTSLEQLKALIIKKKKKKPDLPRRGNYTSRQTLISNCNINSYLDIHLPAYPTNFGPVSFYNHISQFLNIHVCLSVCLSLSLLHTRACTQTLSVLFLGEFLKMHSPSIMHEVISYLTQKEHWETKQNCVIKDCLLSSFSR